MDKSIFYAPMGREATLMAEKKLIMKRVFFYQTGFMLQLWSFHVCIIFQNIMRHLNFLKHQLEKEKEQFQFQHTEFIQFNADLSLSNKVYFCLVTMK